MAMQCAGASSPPEHQAADMPTQSAAGIYRVRCGGQAAMTNRVAHAPLVGEDDDAVVLLAADNAADALAGLPQRVEGEEVLLADAEGVAQEDEARPQHVRQRVLKGDACDAVAVAHARCRHGRPAGS